MEKYALILSALIGTLILIVSLACYKVSQDPSLKHGDFMHWLSFIKGLQGLVLDILWYLGTPTLPTKHL